MARIPNQLKDSRGIYTTSTVSTFFHFPIASKIQSLWPICVPRLYFCSSQSSSFPTVLREALTIDLLPLNIMKCPSSGRVKFEITHSFIKGPHIKCTHPLLKALVIVRPRKVGNVQGSCRISDTYSSAFLMFILVTYR